MHATSTVNHRKGINCSEFEAFTANASCQEIMSRGIRCGAEWYSEFWLEETKQCASRCPTRLTCLEECTGTATLDLVYHARNEIKTEYRYGNTMFQPVKTNKQTNNQTNKQTNNQTNNQTNKQTYQRCNWCPLQSHPLVIDASSALHPTRPINWE